MTCPDAQHPLSHAPRRRDSVGVGSSLGRRVVNNVKTLGYTPYRPENMTMPENPERVCGEYCFQLA